MNKKSYQYHLSLQQTADSNNNPTTNKTLDLDFTNHDDLFKVIEMIQQKDHFQDKNQSTEFAIGLKLFGEIMLRNKEHALFTELFPAFIGFMKKLKS